jgi:hypothetical protein
MKRFSKEQCYADQCINTSVVERQTLETSCLLNAAEKIGSGQHNNDVILNAKEQRS